jgi:DNA-binding beta-propeller fold protein YncE
MIGAPMKLAWRFALVVGCVAASVRAADPPFSPVPELGYRPVPDFFQMPGDALPGEASGVALDSKGHVFVFRRARPMLMEFDGNGRFVRSLGEGLFDHPHGLRIDADDNLWTTDDGSHVVLKLAHDGRVLLVLGKKGRAAEGDWVFNQPTDVAFGKDGSVYVSDGYGNSRVVKLDRTGAFVKAWGTHGTQPGQFDLPHSIAVDSADRVYVGDRENRRIQVFDADGRFLKEWTHVGYPYGLFLTKDQHVWVADGGFDRILELGPDGNILGAFGEPGHGPGQFAWAHFLAVAPDRTLFVADVLNWRVQVFAPTARTGRMTSYVPTARRFWDTVPSTGWSTRLEPR